MTNPMKTLLHSFILAVMALALIAALHGLGSIGFHAAPDLDQLCEAAAALAFDRMSGD